MELCVDGDDKRTQLEHHGAVVPKAELEKKRQVSIQP